MSLPRRLESSVDSAQLSRQPIPYATMDSRLRGNDKTLSIVYEEIKLMSRLR
jgi:hypothetical protein